MAGDGQEAGVTTVRQYFLKHADIVLCMYCTVLGNPRAPTPSEGRYRGMADSAPYAACGQQAATQRHRWARANEQVVASTFRGGGATARRQTRK